MKRILLSLVLVAAVSASASTARASPEGHGAVSLGPCLLDRAGHSPVFPRLCAALRGELLFGRQRDRDFGFGPFVSASTVSFDRYAGSGGLSFLLPVNPTYPFIVSVSGGALHQSQGFSPLVEGWLFWGPSSYNFFSSYAMASGLLLGYQASLGDQRVTVVSIQGQLDLALVALPFILAEQWIAGGE